MPLIIGVCNRIGTLLPLALLGEQRTLASQLPAPRTSLMPELCLHPAPPFYQSTLKPFPVTSGPLGDINLELLKATLQRRWFIY